MGQAVSAALVHLIFIDCSSQGWILLFTWALLSLKLLICTGRPKFVLKDTYLTGVSRTNSRDTVLGRLQTATWSEGPNPDVKQHLFHFPAPVLCTTAAMPCQLWSHCWLSTHLNHNALTMGCVMIIWSALIPRGWWSWLENLYISPVQTIPVRS